MKNKLKHLACFLIYLASLSANSQENLIAEIDKIRADCYSSKENGEFIFITLGLFNEERLGGFIQHNNGPAFRLKYLYPEYIDMTGSNNDSQSLTYAEMMNNKMTGYYTYTWYRGDSPMLKYHSKKKNKPYFLRFDSGADDSKIPYVACDWSKSSRLSEEENN